MTPVVGRVDPNFDPQTGAFVADLIDGADEQFVNDDGGGAVVIVGGETKVVCRFCFDKVDEGDHFRRRGWNVFIGPGGETIEFQLSLFRRFRFGL